jgi:small conductance mechanosensitive channel
MVEWLQSMGLGEQTALMVLEYGMKVLGVLFVLWLGFLVGGKVQSVLTKRLEEKIDVSIARFVGNIARWTIVILAILGCLSMFGVETTSFAAVIGGASVAIGLAFQGSLSNVAAGIMLLIFRPFKVGDVIQIAGNTGTVDEISLFTTMLDTADKRRFIVPNSQVFGSTIENVTYNSERRVDVAVGIEYEADIDTAREVLKAAAAKLDHVIGEPMVVLTGLGGSSVDFSVRVVVPTEHYWPTLDALIRASKYALDEAKIGIPYPHVTVTNKGE